MSQQPESTGPPSGERILVVDDEEPIGALLMQWLRDDGYQAEYAQDFEAVQAAYEEGPVELMTLDIIMPRVDGLEVLSWVRDHHPETAVIMATAMGDLDTVLKAMRLGAVGYVLKPFNMELISQDIDRAMERQRLIRENQAYQNDLERRVQAQTAEIREAHAELEHKVRELEGRDRLVQCQMEGPSREQATAVALEVIAAVAEPERAAICRLEQDSMKPLATHGEPTQADFELARKALTTGETGSGPDAIAVPLVYQNETVGVLVAAGLDQARSAALQRLTQQIALALWSAGISDALDSGDVALQDLMDLE